uniref:Putative ovule protein n=1 Tax=Solanum chacoense TaxID=4108 RepID=A0A0V0GSC1_SOLCH
MRRMTLSSGALWWLCRKIKDASEVRGRPFKTWKVRDVSINIFCSLKFNKFGRFLSVITVNGYSRLIIIIPENKANEEWLGIVNRIESFVNRGSLKHGYAPVTGDLKHQFLRGEDSYKEALQKNRWTAQEPNHFKRAEDSESLYMP